MEARDKLNAPHALPPLELPLYTLAVETGQTLQPMWTIWRREDFLPPPGIELDSPVIQPVLGDHSCFYA
jgi:hypothetical protein